MVKRMEVLPISRDAPSAQAQDDRWDRSVVIRRVRNVDPLFLLVVVVPVLASIIYFAFLATNVYVSESKFVVRSPDKPAATGLGIVLQTAGFTKGQEEVYAAQSFANSRDALRALNRNNAFERAYTRPDIFFLERFAPIGVSKSFEDLYEYFLKKVTVKNDTATSITTLTVRAYDPRDAWKFNRQLLEMAEQTVNNLNERGRLDLVRLASTEVAESRAQAQNAATALAAYRNRSGVIDPEKQAEAQMQMVSKLQDQLIASKTEIQQLMEYAPRNPRIPVIRSQIVSMQREIDSQLGQLTGNSRSLSQSAIQFERLKLANDFAQKQLTASMASLEQARNEAQRKQAYVERIVEPNLPDAPMEPRRTRGVLATIVLSLLAYGILRMLLAGIREHAQ